MADKNFKVKSGLQVPSLTTAGPVVTDNAGNVTSSSTLPISQGGTGQTTAGNALNALLPIQGGSNINKYLQTNGTTTQWNAVTQQTVTDALAGTNIYTGTTAPTSPTTGDIWIDNTTGNGIQLVRWRKTISSATSTISGLDDNNLTLTYTAGNEQIYINGVLITRGQDYTATNGTSISLTQAVEVGDTVEIFGNPLFSVTDTYTQAQANNLYVAKSGFDVAGKNYCINGGFDIWQRGSSFANPNNVYTTDRWFNATNSATITRESSGAPDGSRYYFRTTATGNSSYTDFYYFFETSQISPLWGKTVTYSFKVRKSGTPMIGNFILTLQKSSTVDAGYGASWTTITSSSTPASNIITGTLSSEWTLISLTTTIPNDGSANSLRFIGGYNSAQNSGHIVDLAQVQLEIGSIATPFSRSGGNIQTELAACQRYFIRYMPNSTIGNTMYFASGNAISTTRAMVSISLPTSLRTTPSFAKTSGVALFNQGSNFYLNTSSGPFSSVYQISQNMINLDAWVPSGLTNNTSVMMALVGVNDYVDFSAEMA